MNKLVIALCAVIILITIIPLLIFNVLNIYAEKSALKNFIANYDAKLIGKSGNSYLLDMDGRNIELKFAFYLDSVSSPKRAEYKNTDFYVVYYSDDGKLIAPLNKEGIRRDKGEVLSAFNTYDNLSIFSQGILELGLWSISIMGIVFIVSYTLSKIHLKVQGSK